MVDTKRAIDPITAQVLSGALKNIAIEMGHKLARMSYSSIIRESNDFGCALLDEHGQQLCESVNSTPLQSGPIPGYLQGIREIMAERGYDFKPGDVILHNSSFYGATHQPDCGFFVPVYYKDELIGFSCSTAHQLDLGALSPGSIGIIDAVDCFAEGLQFKAIKVYEEGKPVDMVWRLIRDNVRATDMVVGDMEAQIATCRIGAQRYLELVEKFGLETVRAARDYMIDYSERVLRHEISKIPDGTYHSEGYIDGYLDSQDPKRKDLKFNVNLTVKGDDMIVDLTGTSDQVDDRPINMPFPGTTDMAVYLTIRTILLDSKKFGYIPQNAGLVKPIKIIAPEGTLVNPTYPAPTISRFCPGNALADTIMRALGQAVPDQICAGIGNLYMVAYSGMIDKKYWVYMDIMAGSSGGRYGKDGMDAIDVLYANTRNNPIEDIESHHPLSVTRYEFPDNAAASGKYRGGVGPIRDIEFTDEGGFSVEGEGQKYAPWGFDGGYDGTPSKLIFRDSKGNETSLPSKVPYKKTHAGETLEIVGPCGGGYGDPYTRDPETVLADVLDDYISLDRAKTEFGVVIEDNKILWEETELLRSMLG
ncbi:hydantoinase B/oxoprolinase family protein [Sporolactobacillus laevolacticus]|uniref:hydantoinase B/oxoprolinase family protein n=1 Tax=Sporolactobacillus laevolacticus TaxID=33018 RepID=UPI0025B624D4|nr:hydantoinase B/oxoprolinase family protein [Sporolactobacillus laevolacticus]MDN3954896.1 hydantoinase B/oxoprolinase family protein [Sporolactobacillus laevolacticus]